MAQANIGLEVAEYRRELESVLGKIMAAHTERNGCAWCSGALDAILCDLSVAIERQEICQAKAA